MARGMLGKRGLIIPVIVVIALLVAAGGWYVFGRVAPGRFALVSSRPSATVTPSPQNSAEAAQIRAFCSELAPPSELKRCQAALVAYTSACSSLKASSEAAPAGRWLVGSGSEAGFRVHERFLQIQVPNEAVARTNQVAGGLVVGGASGTPRLTEACVAVSTLQLHSVDVVPGVEVAQREHVFPDVLDNLNHPVATFRATDVALPVPSEGHKQTVRVPGTFSIHGVSRPVTVTLEGVLQGGQLQVVGGFPIALSDYGMAPPDNPIAAVDSTVTIEFHLFLDHR